MTITVELSWPEPALWPNSRPDRRAKAAVASQGRSEAYVAALEALDGRTVTAFTPDVPVRLVGHVPANRKYDRDNFLAACKSRLDGIAQALRLDDVYFDPRVEWGDPKTGGGVTVEIELGN